MKILFSMRHPGALRNFASTLQALAERNHQVHLVFGQRDKQGDDRLLASLTREGTGITAGEVAPKTPWRFWLGLARAVRYSVDYVRYLTPEFEGVTSLRDRARGKAPALMRRLAELAPLRTRAGNALLTRVLLAAERAIPIDRAVFDLVGRERPDLLLVTPLVDIGSDQVDYVKAARRLGVRSALPVLSWDNLTNKGLIRVQPDRVLVWNEAQKAEAVGMHGVDPDEVVVTGAMVYDQWFARRPSTTREAFCARVGLDPGRPILLYVCSSPFIAPDELPFIEQWIAAVRGAPDARIRSAGILIRPHPENLQPWHRFDRLALQDVSVWPRGGASPVDTGSRNDFYDSMYHAVAAVGINTSAQIECGITGRPVFSIRTPAFQRTQDGTLHFRHLTSERAGLLWLADDFETHVGQLAGVLDDPEGTARRIETFVTAFARPHGLDVPATPKMVEALERIAAGPAPAPRGLPLSAYPLRAALYPVAVLLTAGRRFTRVTRKRQRQLRPVTAIGTLVQAVLSALAWVLRARPIRNFAKQQIVPRAVSRLAAANAPTEEAVAVPRLLHRLSRRDQPVIVGPWVSEVGFELLYWIPFLAWVRTHPAFTADRLVVVSRGGCDAWYGDVASHYVDLFDFFEPGELREKAEQRITEGRAKPRTITEFDRQAVKLVRQTRHLGPCELLHPTYMYRLFQPFWQGRAPAAAVEEFALFRPLPPPDTRDVAGALPDDYVAVRFHFNDAFPPTEANRRFVRDLVDALAETTDVVVLDPPPGIDDRADAPVPARGRVHGIAHLMTPRTNLRVQSQVIARARAFVGTQGGLSYLAPLYGVQALSFYSQAHPSTARHLELARAVFGGMRPGSYVALDVSDLDTLRAAFGEQHEVIAGLARRLSRAPTAR